MNDVPKTQSYLTINIEILLNSV